MTILDPRVDSFHAELLDVEDLVGDDHVHIDALKEIVIGLTARVNELEFALHRQHPMYGSSPFFRR